jgi:CHAT domain-containing protein/tetratricopeptide (TPR) repeat protein
MGMHRFGIVFVAVCVAALQLLPPAVSPAAAQSRKEGTADKSDSLGALNRRMRELASAGRYAEAARVAEQLAAAVRARYGDNHPSYGTVILRQGLMYRHDRRYAEAEPLIRRALEIYEGAYGPDDPKVGSALLALAQVLRRTHRVAEAEGLLRRGLAIQEKALGPDDVHLSPMLNSLAIVLMQQRKLADAEAAYRRALAIQEKGTGPENRTVAVRLSNLASILIRTNRAAEAEPMVRRALAITEKALGPDHPNVAGTLNTLARLLRATNRPAEAEPLLQRVVSINEKAFGPRHVSVGAALFNLSVWYSEQGDWTRAAELGRRAIPILAGRGQDAQDAAPEKEADDEEDEDQQDDEDKKIDDRPRVDSGVLADRTNAFRAHARALHRAFPGEVKAQEEAYAAAQWAMQTGAADALAQMSVRFAKGSGALGALVRERQDLLSRRATEDRRLLDAIGRNDGKAISELRKALNTIDGQLDLVDDKLARDFKEFAELSTPAPLAIPATQALLRPNEALVLLLDIAGSSRLEEESLIFVVTREASRWSSVPLGRRALASSIAALRCGLDDALWQDASNWPQTTEDEKRQRAVQLERRQRCHALTKAAPRTELAGLIPIEVLPFDVERAHDLYQSLFGPIEDLIKDKHLLIVPSGALTALPFHVLVTQPPAEPLPQRVGAYADVAWLAKSNPITVLPSVGSLKALRSFAKAGKATSSFLGIGNPLLTGPSGTDRRAWTRLSCAQAAPPSVQVASRGMPGSVSRLFGSGLADIELVRRQQPLPETADELCAVALSTGATGDTVLLGEKASETTVKRLSADGTLSNARVVHFATHGLLAREVGRARAAVAEPALVLTPPRQATEQDDGLLTASEVAQLRLDADWVVLSACNTAAGESDSPGAEALSGLARAFFYAGARALLVSHWSVDSRAAVSIVTKTFDEIRSDPGIGRAEALRRSMVALLSSGGRNAHPATWAPFVVVGEGAR